MTAIVLPALVVYAALKSGQFAFSGRASGYRQPSASLGRRLRRGEPLLLIVATLITVPPALAASWYHRSKFEAVLRDSIRCDGLIAAYQDDRAIRDSTAEHVVYEAFSSYRSTALDAARQLGIEAGIAQRRLDATASALAGERRHADRRLHEVRVSAARRCLHPPLDDNA